MVRAESGSVALPWWRHVGSCPRTGLHFGQPIVHPCENQKQDCPLLQVLEPFVQRQLYGSMVPVIGCLPPDHAGRSASIEFRASGMIIDPCPSTVATTREKTMLFCSAGGKSLL